MKLLKYYLTQEYKLKMYLRINLTKDIQDVWQERCKTLLNKIPELMKSHYVYKWEDSKF